MTRLLFLFLSVCFFFVSSMIYACEAGESPVVTDQFSFVLSRCDNTVPYNVSLDFEGREIAFRKEPDFGGRNIVRGALHLGQDASSSICFAWDADNRKLYIDLNGNLDLSDDPAGILTCEGSHAWPERYTGIQVSSTDERGTRRYLVDINLYNPLNPTGFVTIRSGWQADVALAGKLWRMLVVDDLNGVIDEKDGLFLVPIPDGKLRNEISFLDRLASGNSLIMDDREYSVSYTFSRRDTVTVLNVDMKEQHPAIGELAIDGRAIRNIYLDRTGGAPTSAILNEFDGELKIPAGDYTVKRIVIEDDSLGVYYADRAVKFTVPPDGKAMLTAGAPLTHTVNMSRRGRNIELLYELKDGGGNRYQTLDRSQEKQPEFSIFKGDRLLFSGSFTYG